MTAVLLVSRCPSYLSPLLSSWAYPDPLISIYRDLIVPPQENTKLLTALLYSVPVFHARYDRNHEARPLFLFFLFFCHRHMGWEKPRGKDCGDTGERVVHVQNADFSPSARSPVTGQSAAELVTQRAATDPGTRKRIRGDMSLSPSPSLLPKHPEITLKRGNPTKSRAVTRHSLRWHKIRAVGCSGKGKQVKRDGVLGPVNMGNKARNHT